MITDPHESLDYLNRLRAATARILSKRDRETELARELKQVRKELREAVRLRDQLMEGLDQELPLFDGPTGPTAGNGAAGPPADRREDPDPADAASDAGKAPGVAAAPSAGSAWREAELHRWPFAAAALDAFGALEIETWGDLHAYFRDGGTLGGDLDLDIDQANAVRFLVARFRQEQGGETLDAFPEAWLIDPEAVEDEPPAKPARKHVSHGHAPRKTLRTFDVYRRDGFAAPVFLGQMKHQFTPGAKIIADAFPGEDPEKLQAVQTTAKAEPGATLRHLADSKSKPRSKARPATSRVGAP